MTLTHIHHLPLHTVIISQMKLAVRHHLQRREAFLTHTLHLHHLSLPLIADDLI